MGEHSPITVYIYLDLVPLLIFSFVALGLKIYSRPKTENFEDLINLI